MVWHDQPWFLIGGLVVLLAIIAWVAWPLNESQLRRRAEKLIAQDTRSSLSEAKNKTLRQLLVRFPDGPHADWAQDQIDRINVIQFLNQLSVKIKNNWTVTDQGELLHKQAQQIASDGDYAEAIDKYHSMITILGESEEYETAVNAARYQIAKLEDQSVVEDDATQIVRQKLDEADALMSDGRVVEARKIWYSIVESYGDNSNLAPLIREAQSRLAEED